MNYLYRISSFFKKNFFLSYFLSALVIYAIFFMLYEPVTLGFDAEDITVLAVPTILGLWLFQYFMAHTIWNRAFWAHGITGLAWVLTFPLLFHWSYTKPFYFYEFSNDFLFGLLLFILLTSLQYLLTLPEKHPNIIAFIFSIFNFLLLLIPLAQIFYYILNWHCISPDTLMAFYNTNFMESLGFLKSNLGWLGIIGLILGCVCLIYAAYLSNKQLIHIVTDGTSRPLRKVAITVTSFVLIIYLPFFLFAQTCIISSWNEASAYMKEMQKFNDYHKENAEQLILSPTPHLNDKLPGTVIVVIGESASRTFMKAYNPEFIYENTPWLSKEKESNNFYLFQKAYSSYVQTVPSLERALTEKNQYADKPFIETVSILDVARKAGYYTTWLSNQGVYGEYDTAISLIAKTADQALWSHDSYMFSDKYDGALLPLLDRIPQGKNNLVIIHLMGSHIYYNDRYPSEFSKWKKGSIPTGLEAYSNSILYTDWVLQNIYEYGKKNLNLQAMIYFSDHGESIDKSHNPDTFDFDMTRIPVFVYLSPQYQKTFPQVATQLKLHENTVFTNDLAYDLISGILQAPSNRYSPEFDFSSPQYNINEQNALTMLSTVHITEDPLFYK